MRPCAREDGSDLRGYAIDLLGTYRFAARFAPHLILGYAFGSGDGDPDDDRDHNFRQTGLQGNESEVGGLTPFSYYGEAFYPEVSNLSILTVGLGARPTPRLSADLIYHDYRQDEAADELRDAAIDAEPSGRSRELGSELDLVLGFEEIGDVRRAGPARGEGGLIRDLELARAEGESWRAKVESSLNGIRAEIGNQFRQWGTTAAEQEIGLLILKGLNHKQIAALRGTSEATVRQQAQAIYRKADLPGRTAFSAYFLEDLSSRTAWRGIVPPVRRQASDRGAQTPSPSAPPTTGSGSGQRRFAARADRGAGRYRKWRKASVYASIRHQPDSATAGSRRPWHG